MQSKAVHVTYQSMNTRGLEPLRRRSRALGIFVEIAFAQVDPASRSFSRK